VNDAATPFTVSLEISKPRKSRSNRDRFCVALARDRCLSVEDVRGRVVRELQVVVGDVIAAVSPVGEERVAQVRTTRA
jgi:hypothetical protein